MTTSVALHRFRYVTTFYRVRTCQVFCEFQQVLSSSWDGRPFGRNRYGPKIGIVPLLGGELGLDVTQCGMVRGLPSCQVSS